MGFRSVVCHPISSAWQETKRARAVLCVLMLAFVAFIVQDSMNVYMSSQTQVLPGVAFLLGNPFLAVVYLSMPYVVMLAIDIRARRKDKKDEQLDKITTMYLERSRVEEQEAAEEETSVTDEYARKGCLEQGE